MAKYERILITGAAGRLGTQLRDGLQSLAERIRISDRIEIKDVSQNEEVFTCELGDYDAVLEMTKGVDAIVHFGGVALEDSFEKILDGNIRGTYHIYEGARKNGVRRVIYASSVHAIGYHLMESQIDANSPVRPDSLYGVSKVFVEGLSRLYWDKFGIETLCLRIFSSFPEPADRRMLWSWMSFQDCVRYVAAGLTAPRVGHTIGFGMSDNTIKPVSDRKAKHIGYFASDSSEPYRGKVESSTDEPLADATAVKYLGGWFCDLPHPADEQ